METDFPVLMPALRRVEHLRGVRLLNAKLPGASADETVSTLCICVFVRVCVYVRGSQD